MVGKYIKNPAKLSTLVYLCIKHGIKGPHTDILSHHARKCETSGIKDSLPPPQLSLAAVDDILPSSMQVVSTVHKTNSKCLGSKYYTVESGRQCTGDRTPLTTRETKGGLEGEPKIRHGVAMVANKGCQQPVYKKL